MKLDSEKTDSLIELLRSEFSNRCKRNPSYSLRAYSRDLNVDASNLSKLLKYQVTPGNRLKSKLAQKMGLDQTLAEEMILGSDSKVQDKHYSEHAVESFRVIADWYHYALLELVKLEDFKSSEEWMARKLNMNKETVRDALARLKTLNLLTQSGSKLKCTQQWSSSLLAASTSKAQRKQQKQILEGAISALDQVPEENRSQSSMTMAIDKRKLPQAKILIKKFRRQLARYLSESSKLDDVYQLSISLYPVTNVLEKENL